MPDVSALGAAYLSGLESGVFKDIAHLQRLQTDRKKLTPCADNGKVRSDYQGWQENVYPQ
jgi:glycerol kinase